MDEELKNEAPEQQPVPVEDKPVEQTTQPVELKSDESLRPQIEAAAGVYEGIERALFDPLGLIKGRSSESYNESPDKDRAERALSVVHSLPDAVMDVVGLMGEKGAAIDNFYDDVTRFNNPDLQKVREVMSIVVPSFYSFGAVGAGTKALKLKGLSNGLAQLGGNAVLDGLVNYTSDTNENQESTLRYLANTFPGWFGGEGRIPLPEAWMTQQGMTPEQIREVHFWENTGFSVVADLLAYSVSARKPIMGFFQPLNEQAAKWKQANIFQNADRGTDLAISKLTDQIENATAQRNLILQELATNPTGPKLKGLQEQLQGWDVDLLKLQTQQGQLAEQYAKTGVSAATDNGLNSTVERNQLSRNIQNEEVGLQKLEADLENINGFDPDITPGLATDAQRAGSNAITPGNVAENMVDTSMNYRGISKGDNTSLVTGPMYRKGFGLEDGSKSRNAVEGFARQTEEMGDWAEVKSGFRLTKAQMNDDAWAIAENILHAGDVRGVKQLFLTDQDFVAMIQGATRQRALIPGLQQVEVDARAQFIAMKQLVDRFVGRSVMESSARVMDTLGRDIATTASSVTRFGPEAVDNSRAMEVMLDKLEFLMNEYGINKYVSGWMLNNKHVWQQAVERGDDLGALAKELGQQFEDTLRKKGLANKKYRKVLQAAAEEDPNLLKAFVEAFAVTDGDVDTIAKLHAWGEAMIHPRGAIHSGKTKGKLNLFASGLKTIRFNNVLSGKAALNAAKGNVTAIIGKPLRAFIHAGLDRLKTGDAEAVKRVNYLYGAMYETNRIAIQDAWHMMKRVHMDQKGLQKAIRKDFVVKEEKTWEAMDALAEVWKKEGNTGKVTMYNLSKQLHKIGSNRWYRGSMTIMSGIDSYTNTMLAHYWSRALAYEEIAAKHGYPFTQWIDGDFGKAKAMMQEAEKVHYHNFFDKNGLPKDDALKYFSGEVNLNLDHNWSDQITKATNAMPLLQGMFMFPRTGVQDVLRRSSYLPFTKIPGFNNRYTKILAAGDDVDLIKEALKEHGIDFDTYPHAMSAYKVLKEEYEARLAFSGMLASSLIAMSVGGLIVNQKIPIKIRGSGHYQHGRRKKERDLYNVVSKSFQIPGTNQWISFKGVDALDPILSLVGDMGYYYNDLSAPMLDDIYQKLMWTISANFLNETPLAGLEPLVALTSGDSSWFSRWSANEVRSYIPVSGALGVFANALDGAYKNVHDDLTGYIKNRLPILKSTLPSHVDIFTGEDIKSTRGPFQALSPSPMYDGGEEWRQKLFEIGWTPTTILRMHSSGDYEYSPEEQELIATYIGKKTDFGKRVIKYMNNPHFEEEIQQMRISRMRNQRWTRVRLQEKNLPVFQYLNAALRKAQLEAEAMLATEHPEMMRSIDYQIMINNKLKKGKVQQAIELADTEEETFEKIKGVLQYANPPKK